MLLDFEGIIDMGGLRSLQQHGGALRMPACDRAAVPFWAALDHRQATVILRELLAGNRNRALLLLEEFSFALGSKFERN